MLFWILVPLVGFLGGIADVIINRWGETLLARWWIAGAAGYLAFMTSFAVVLRLGNLRGYSITITVILVLLANIVIVAMWDVLKLRSSFTFLQMVGFLLAISAIICFQIGGRK